MKGHLSFPGTASRNKTWTAEDEHVAQLMEVFGPFPKGLLKRSTRSKEFFDDEGMLEPMSSQAVSNVLSDKF